MNWTKTSLKKSIEEARIGIDLAAKITQALNEFERYARVDKRFVDRMKELDCHAYIQKDQYSTTLSITKSESNNLYKAEFRLYISHVMSGEGLTWETIRNELKRYDFEGRLSDAKKRLDLIEKETNEAKELLEIIRSKKFTCFDFYKSVFEIEGAVREALN